MKLKKKSESELMLLLAKLPFVPKSFLDFYWTTIGSTVYTPSRLDRDRDWGTEAWKARHRSILEHEAVHIDQWRRLNVLMWVMYIGPAPFILPFVWLWFPWLLIAFFCLLPLSVGLAWGRWTLEREAYLKHVHTDKEIDWVSKVLWSDYFFAWPPFLVRRWFKRHL